MKIQSLSIATPFTNKVKSITFGNKKVLSDFAQLKDVFEKSEDKTPETKKTEIRYYYPGADGEAHETTAPFITKQTEFGERLYIMRSGNGKVKPRPFGGFTVEKELEGDKQKTTIYKSGYPQIVEEYENKENTKTTIYNTQSHKVESVRKGDFQLEQNSFNDAFSMELHDKDEEGNNCTTSVSISNDSDELSYAEITVIAKDEYSTNCPFIKNCAIYWNYLGEIPKKLEGLDKDSIKALYDSLRNMAITIQSDEFGADFGNNNKFTYSLEEILHHIERKLS